jgi:hypothetical protein
MKPIWRNHEKIFLFDFGQLAALTTIFNEPIDLSFAV